MAKWYYLEEGLSKGPYTNEEIEQKLKSGDLGRNDLLYKEGAKKWMSLSEWEEFKKRSPTVPLPKTPKANWMILIHEGENIRQVGPFDEKKILSMLKSGELTVDHQVWQEGMHDWYKVGSLPQFQVAHQGAPLKALEPKLNVQQIYKESAQSLLKNVQIQKRELPKNQTSQSPPAQPTEKVEAELAKIRQSLDAMAKDLKLTGGQRKTMAEKVYESSTRPPQEVVKILRTPQPSPTRGFVSLFFEVLGNELRGLFPRGGFLRLIFFGLIIFICAGIVFYSAFKDKDKNLSALSRVEKQKQKLRAEEEAKKSVPPSKEVVKPQSKEPTYIKVFARNVESAEAHVEIQSDGTSPHKFLVVIHGIGGGVIRAKSFYREFSVSAGKETKVVLSKLNLPLGSYHVTVKFREIVKDLKFFYGTYSDEFAGLLKKHKKAISLWHQKEKRALFSSTKKMEGLNLQLKSLLSLRQNNRRWQRAVRNWERKLHNSQSIYLKRIAEKKFASFVHPDMWLELKQLQTQLVSLAHKSSLSANELTELQGQLDKFTEKVTDLSFW